MPNNKKYQIFISSTYSDLITERDAVRNVILEMYQFPIGMEMFSVSNGLGGAVGVLIVKVSFRQSVTHEPRGGSGL